LISALLALFNSTLARISLQALTHRPCRAIHRAYNTRYNPTRGAAMKIKITTVGNSVGIILPKELLARLRMGKGDTLYATELPDGFKLSAFDPKLAGQLEVAERIMREDRNVLRKLSEN
jgi:putative addiction module antidote